MEPIIQCSGEWIDGSGGHRIHNPCNQEATWLTEDDMFAYCDKHIVEHDKPYYTRKINDQTKL